MYFSEGIALMNQLINDPPPGSTKELKRISRKIIFRTSTLHCDTVIQLKSSSHRFNLQLRSFSACVQNFYNTIFILDMKYLQFPVYYKNLCLIYAWTGAAKVLAKHTCNMEAIHIKGTICGLY